MKQERDPLMAVVILRKTVIKSVYIVVIIKMIISALKLRIFIVKSFNKKKTKQLILQYT